MSNILLTRGLLEVSHDRNTVTLLDPSVADVALENGRLWFRLKCGRVVTASEYKQDCECRADYLGFSVIFVLENEDALTQVRIPAMRLRHRVAVTRPRTNLDMSVCLMLYAAECLPLTRGTILDMLSHLEGLPRPKTKLAYLMRESCRRLLNSGLYLYYDDETADGVPRVYVLFRETQLARAHVIVETVFRTAQHLPPKTPGLDLVHRRTLDGINVRDLVREVLTEGCHSFYVPLTTDGTETTWLSNELTHNRS